MADMARYRRDDELPGVGRPVVRQPNPMDTGVQQGPALAPFVPGGSGTSGLRTQPQAADQSPQAGVRMLSNTTGGPSRNTGVMGGYNLDGSRIEPSGNQGDQDALRNPAPIQLTPRYSFVGSVEDAKKFSINTGINDPVAMRNREIQQQQWQARQGFRRATPGSRWDALLASDMSPGRKIEALKAMEEAPLREAQANWYNAQTSELPAENASQQGYRAAQIENFGKAKADSKLLPFTEKIPTGQVDGLGNPIMQESTKFFDPETRQSIDPTPGDTQQYPPAFMQLVGGDKNRAEKWAGKSPAEQQQIYQQWLRENGGQ